MKNLCCFILSLFFFGVCLSQSKAKQIVTSPYNSVKLDTFKVQLLKLQSDTVYLRSFSSDSSPERKTFMEQNGMWIAALCVGIIAGLINIWISLSSRRTTLETLKEQMQVSKELALAQIENAQAATQQDFNKTVLSGNRQTWINDLRDIVSKLLALITTKAIAKSLTPEDIKEIRYLITKAELMVHPEKDIDFVYALIKLENQTIKIVDKTEKPDTISEYIKEVKDQTQTILKTEWERVKKGE